MSAYVHLVANAFQPQHAERHAVIGGALTLRGWLERNFQGFTEFTVPTICVVNGHAKLRADWDRYVIEEEDVVGFVALPQAPVVVAWIAIAIAVASIAYAMLLPKPGVPDQSQPDSVFNLRGQHNQLKLGSGIESAYGRVRLYPSYAAKPYTVYNNNDQYQFDLYCLGQGEYACETPMFEDTPITSFPDVTYAFYGPGEIVDMFKDNVITSSEVSALEMKAPNESSYPGYYGPYVCNPAGTTTDEIEVDLTFPAGLYLMSDGGKQGWKDVWFDVQYQLINDAGVAIGSWTSFSGALGRSGNTTTAIRFTYNQLVTAGRYQVRAKRITDKNTSTSCANTLNWEALRCFLPSTRVYGNVTMMAVKARASNNLNDNAANRLNLWATRKLPIWNGTTWSAATATRNPVWAFCDVFRATYGARLNASYLDLATLLTLAGTLATEGRNFDYVFDQKITVWEAAKLIARSFRGAPIPSGTQVTIVRDVPKSVPTAVFTPENIVAGSFTWGLALHMPNDYDSVLVRYTSPTTWKEETVLCCVGDDAGDNPEDLQLPGITDRTWAWREGMAYRAYKKYPAESVKFTTGLEGHIPSFMDYVLVSHDRPRWGKMTGLVTAIASDLRTVTLSEPVDFTGGGAHVLGIRKKNGALSGPYTVTAGSSAKEVISTTDITEAFYFDNAHELPMFLFGTSVNYGIGAVIRGLAPTSEDTVEVTANVYSDIPFANDAANPDDPDTIVNPDSGPGIPDFDCSTLAVGWIPQTDKALVSWSAALGGRNYIVESSTDNATWKYEGITQYTSLVIPAIAGAFHVRVQALGRTGNSDWCQVDFTDFEPVVQDPVTSLAAESGTNQLLKTSDGSVLAQVSVTWVLPSVDFAAVDGHIEILYKRSTDTVYKSKMLGAGATQYLITPAHEGDTINISVRAISYLGVKSVFVTLNHVVVGKTALPTAPTNVALDATNIPLLNMEATDLFPASPYYGTRVKWDPVADLDLDHYEVKATATDSDAATNMVWRTPKNLSVQVVEVTVETEIVLYSIVTGYTGYVRVRSVDTTGNASAWVRCTATCDSTYSISGAISETQSGSLLGRKSAGDGTVEHVPTDTTFSVTSTGISTVGLKAVPASGGTAELLKIRRNGTAVEWSNDNGSTWNAVGGTSSPLTTKGDLYAYSTTNARQAIGADKTTLVADSTQATGMKYVTLAQFLEYIGTCADGDMLVRVSGAWTRVAKGSDTNVWTMTSGAPGWAAPAAASVSLTQIKAYL